MGRNSSVLGTVATVAGISAIALTTANGETKTAAVSALAGLSSPLVSQAGGLLVRRRPGAATGDSGRFKAEFSED